MSERKKGVLTVISGFSGVGKGTIVKELLNKYPEEYALSISATTRKPRVGEENGREYFFVTKCAFRKMIREEALFEHAEYNGNFYGTPKAYVIEQLSKGKNVILEIDVQGAIQIKKMFPEAFLLFIIAPDAVVLKNRLTGRGTETEEQIENRMNRAVEECDFMVHYDDVAINDDLALCVENVHEMVTKGKRSGLDPKELSPRLKQELITLQKEK